MKKMKTIKGLAVLMVLMVLITATMFTSCNKNEFDSVSSDQVVTITIAPPSADATKVTTTETTKLTITGWESGDKVDLYKLGTADNDYTKVEFSCTDAGKGKFSGTLPSGVSLEDLTFAIYNATIGEYHYDANPSQCNLQLTPKSQASTTAKGVIVMTAIKNGSGFTMKVVNNILKVTKPTGGDIEAAWKWRDHSTYNYITEMSVEQHLDGNLDYLIESISAPGNFNNAKFALKANADNYLFLIPGVDKDTDHSIGLAGNGDAANAASLVGLKQLASISATGGKCYTVVLDDLSKTGTANCYIVPASGNYKFKGNVKGNSSTALGGTPFSADVLWESFGTSTAPSVGDIVNNVSFADGYVHFTATGAKGNAVIAVRDASSNILWSWHIWCTDVPVGQVYNNGAGIMMDRNLGATSATPGDVKALGLMYQWGRKDPFLGSSSISSSAERAASTLSWPEPVYPNGSYDHPLPEGYTVEQSIANPTTFIKINEGWGTHGDWDYDSFIDHKNNSRWESSTKTIYDPCPQGWKVPAGGEHGVWSTAFGVHIAWIEEGTDWDSTNKGVNFGSTSITSKKLGEGTIWYPATGEIDFETGKLVSHGWGSVGTNGVYWSCTCDKYAEYSFGIGLCTGFADKYGYVNPTFWNDGCRAYGRAVRCVKE